MMKKLRVSDFGGLLDDAQKGDAKPWFKPVTVTWSDPERIRPNDDVPLSGEDYLKNGYLYALVKNHGNQRVKDQILYIGITNNLRRRFLNHPKFWDIVKEYSSVYFTVGEPDFHGYRTAEKEHNRKAIEELEHIFIWTLYEYLENYQKVFLVPGISKEGARSWMIENAGYRFSGNMPRRIVYPWAATLNW